MKGVDLSDELNEPRRNRGDDGNVGQGGGYCRTEVRKIQSPSFKPQSETAPLRDRWRVLMSRSCLLHVICAWAVPEDLFVAVGADEGARVFAQDEIAMRTHGAPEDFVDQLFE